MKQEKKSGIYEYLQFALHHSISTFIIRILNFLKWILRFRQKN